MDKRLINKEYAIGKEVGRTKGGIVSSTVANGGVKDKKIAMTDETEVNHREASIGDQAP